MSTQTPGNEQPVANELLNTRAQLDAARKALEELNTRILDLGTAASVAPSRWGNIQIHMWTESAARIAREAIAASKERE